MPVQVSSLQECLEYTLSCAILLYILCSSVLTCAHLLSVIVSAESANDVSRKDPGNQAETRGKLREKATTLADAAG